MVKPIIRHWRLIYQWKWSNININFEIKPEENTPAFTLHHTPTILVIFLMRLLQWCFIEMNQFRRLSCSRAANSFISPSGAAFRSLEYCSAAGVGVRLTSNPGFATLRNTSQFKHSPDKSSTSFCNKTEANSNSVISKALSPQNALEHPHSRLNSESKEKTHSDRGKTQCTENYIRYSI